MPYIGYYLTFAQVSSKHCASASANGLATYTRDMCPYVQQCSPMSACVGNNICDSGYIGSLCSTCDTGMLSTLLHHIMLIISRYEIFVIL